jgi:integrase
MARGRKGTGVEPRANDYRIRFTWHGTRYAERVPLKPSIANGKHVARLADDVKRAIAAGTFTFAKFFPDSPHAIAADNPAAITTFGQYTDRWLKTRSSPPLAPWTLKKDKLYAKFWKKKIGHDRDIRALKPSELAAIVGAHPWPSTKHRNNVLQGLRGPLELAVADRLVERSPAEGIKNGTPQKAQPDPFALDQVELILEDLYRHYDERVGLYYEVAFFSGMRPEEEIVAGWAKWDARSRILRIDEARSGGAVKGIKNHEARDHEANERLVSAIERCRKWTQLKDHGCILENPRTGRPWISEADQRDLYWTPTLKRLQLRHRRAYQTRSTYCTMNLAAAANPAWIARQAGHSLKVFFECTRAGSTRRTTAARSRSSTPSSRAGRERGNDCHRAAHLACRGGAPRLWRGRSRLRRLLRKARGANPHR